MKRRLIKTMSMVAMAATMFAVTTGFTTIKAPEAKINAPVVSISNDHSPYTPCGTHRSYIYGEWSDKYYVRSFTMNFSWYSVYERTRTVYVVCTDCQKVISCYQEYQQRTYALSCIPTGGWYYV